uniref:Uncharacterized protein n=1 Tax=Spiroplasma kunkelii TaxID=47834 RepID=Q6XYT4_SPIKU|nr:hypothetical protein [Spiroplasma kunkelii CR2-3x]
MELIELLMILHQNHQEQLNGNKKILVIFYINIKKCYNYLQQCWGTKCKLVWWKNLKFFTKKKIVFYIFNILQNKTIINVNNAIY